MLQVNVRCNYHRHKLLRKSEIWYQAKNVAPNRLILAEYLLVTMNATQIELRETKNHITVVSFINRQGKYKMAQYAIFSYFNKIIYLESCKKCSYNAIMQHKPVFHVYFYNMRFLLGRQA